MSYKSQETFISVSNAKEHGFVFRFFGVDMKPGENPTSEHDCLQARKEELLLSLILFHGYAK